MRAVLEVETFAGAAARSTGRGQQPTELACVGFPPFQLMDCQDAENGSQLMCRKELSVYQSLHPLEWRLQVLPPGFRGWRPFSSGLKLQDHGHGDCVTYPNGKGQ